MHKPNLPMAALLVACLTAGASAAQAPRPGPADTNQDGAVSKTEFTAERIKRTMRLDGDGDGRISAAEWSARPAGPNAGSRDPARAFARLDANKDGGLDASEIGRVSDLAYSRLDADRDGKLTPAEQRAQMAQRRAARAK